MQRTEAEEQLDKILQRSHDYRLKGVTARDVEPSIDPGHVVLKKRCKCMLRSIIYMPDASSGCGFHHHLVKVPEDLWRRLSEERGWPQERWRISEDGSA